MANNNILFDAAFSAAASQVHDAAYVSAFATAVDGGIAAGSFSVQDATLLQSVCTGVLSARLLSTTTSAAAAATAAVALFTTLRPSLLNAGGGIDVQSFSGPGTYTWTKPAFAKRCTVYVFPVGGPAGSGRKQTTAATNATGGGAGAVGIPKVLRDIDAAQLGATETVTIGANGTGGAAQTVNNTNGNPGVAGGTTSFGSLLSAAAGQAGAGGTTGSGSAGSSAAGFDGLNPIAAGAIVSGNGVNGTASDGAASPSLLPSGGGSGGGVGTLGTVATPGGNAGSLFNAATLLGGTVGAGQNGSNGANGMSLGTSPVGGQSGSGGAGNTTGANAGSGGNGGFPSGAGGGGGGANNGGNSGPGGNSGGALVLVITQCAAA